MARANWLNGLLTRLTRLGTTGHDGHDWAGAVFPFGTFKHHPPQRAKGHPGLRGDGPSSALDVAGGADRCQLPARNTRTGNMRASQLRRIAADTISNSDASEGWQFADSSPGLVARLGRSQHRGQTSHHHLGYWGLSGKAAHCLLSGYRPCQKGHNGAAHASDTAIFGCPESAGGAFENKRASILCSKWHNSPNSTLKTINILASPAPPGSPCNQGFAIVRNLVSVICSGACI